MQKQLTIFDFDFSKEENYLEKFKIRKPVRLIELFAGIGAQATGLKKAGINFEHYKVVEFDKYPLTSYNAIHGTNFPVLDITKIKGENLEIIDTDRYCYIMTYSFPCITKNNLIFTTKGYIKMNDVKVGDIVLTKSNTWQKVVKKFDNGEQDVYLLKAFGTAGIECTKEHKFFARKMYRKGHESIRCFEEPKMIYAKELTNKHYLGIPVIKEETPFYTDNLDFWYVVGMYLGDGWIPKKDKSIKLGLNSKKLQKLSKTSYKFSCYKNNNCFQVRITDKELYDFIKQYIGTGSNNKKIPKEILTLPKEQLKSLYQGYLDTDGCVIKNKHQFSSINESMVYSIVSIIHKLFNRPASVYKIKAKPTKKIENRIVNQKDWFQIRFKLTENKQDKAFFENDYIWFPFKSLEFLKKDNVYNMEIENDHSYIVNGLVSANCQDLSLAGKQAGMTKDSGTRSGLLWEVERLLTECENLPQVLLLENVPQIHNKKNMADFQLWIDRLSELGYDSFWEDLNSKDYGIPQNRNRTFMVSILKEKNGVSYYYEFPKKQPLNLRLRDMLEDEVDEKYYLSEKMMKYIIADNEKWTGNNGKSLVNKDIASTINTGEGTRRCDASNYICDDLPENTDIKVIAKATLDTMQGGYRQPKIFIKEKTKKGYAEAYEGDDDFVERNDVGVVVPLKRGYSVEVKEDNPNDTDEIDIIGNYSKSNYMATNIVGKNGVSPTVRENHGQVTGITTLWTETQAKMINEDGNVKRYINSDIIDEFNEGQAADISFPNGYNKGPRVHNECPALNTTTTQSSFITKTQNLRIRKLTPKECWRLMGFDDESFEKASKINSNTQLYKQAGNSIVVDVLTSIFKEMKK